MIEVGGTLVKDFQVKDDDGQPADAGTVEAVVHWADGTTDAATVTDTGTGEYQVTFTPCTKPGWCRLEVTGSGANSSWSPTSFSFWVRDLSNDYTRLSDLKNLLAITRSSDDDALYLAIDAAQAWINSNVRTFAKSTTAEPRRFTLANKDLLLVDDIATADDLEVATSNGDGTYTALPASSWTTWPTTALTGVPARPVTGIRLVGGCWRIDAYGVQVTARWGWPTIPPEVSQAALLLSARLFKRKDSPSGLVEGVGEIGLVRITASDADVRSLLGPFMLPGFA